MAIEAGDSIPPTYEQLIAAGLPADMECELSFKEQCKIVWSGIKKGVKYDGCTRVANFDFGYDCCGEHDFHYQLDDETKSRASADADLRRCIIKKGYPFIAWMYWIGVRCVGWKFYRRKQNEALAKRGTPDDPNGP